MDLENSCYPLRRKPALLPMVMKLTCLFIVFGDWIKDVLRIQEKFLIQKIPRYQHDDDPIRGLSGSGPANPLQLTFGI